MTYLTLQELKDAVKPAGRTGEEFFETHPEPEQEELLQTLEERARAIINNQLKGEGYERETDRVDTFDAPDKPHIQLAYPVDDVSKVETSIIPDGDWNELDTDKYSFDGQKVKLRESLTKVPQRNNMFFNVQNPLKREARRYTWNFFCDRVRVTYDRGYETANVPDGIKDVTQELVRRMLVHYRQEQNLANLSPEDVQNFNQRRLLTEDIQARIDEFTQTRNRYVMLR